MEEVVENESKYFPCTTCADVLYVIEVAGKPILCCESCSCVDYNIDAMTDTQPQSERSVKIHSLSVLSVAARNLMMGCYPKLMRRI